MLNKKLFLCGSLCKGMTHHKLIEDAILDSQSASVLGSAYRLEVGFPVFCSAGSDEVKGELVELKNLELIWPLMDQFFMYNAAKADKSLYLRELVTVRLGSEITEAYTYSLNPAKKPKTAKLIAGGDWLADFQAITPLTTDLNEEEAHYIKKLGQCSGREIVPYTPLTRILEKRGYVVDKGRRPALTKLGKELFQFLV
jgi:gamma-glutamylcyclotransferase (GGCT)/AIG2-like uncharacterized protein YtfP